MSRPGVIWLASCAVTPWLVAAVWNLIDARAHLLDRTVRALTDWSR